MSRYQRDYTIAEYMKACDYYAALARQATVEEWRAGQDGYTGRRVYWAREADAYGGIKANLREAHNTGWLRAESLHLPDNADEIISGTNQGGHE